MPKLSIANAKQKKDTRMSKLSGQVSKDFIRLNPEFFGTVPQAKPEELPPPKKKAIRQKTKEPNKLERDFHQWLISRPTYLNVIPQGIGIRLGNGVVYWPDFSCVNDAGRTLIWETKGRRHSTGQAKIKIAASLHPEWQFIYVERSGNDFTFQQILP